MLNDQERAIIQYAKENGKSKMEAKAALARYRKSQATLPAQNNVEPEQSGSFSQKAGKVLNTIFGGEKIGEAIGTQIARSRATDDEKQFISGPSGKEVAGDVARSALLFSPVGRTGNAIGKGLSALGLRKGAATAGQIVSGGATGAGFDVADDAAENREFGLGGGFIVGAGIPAASPVASALTRTVTRGVGRVGSEISGALTGTSAETLEQGFNAAKKGGKDETAFVEALRGKTTPENLVNGLKDGIQRVNTSRQTLFKETLAELGDDVIETSPAKRQLQSILSDAKIGVKDNGTLDFSRSGKLELVPQAQSKIETAYQRVLALPEKATLEQVDDARQAIKALSLTGDDPSAKLGNKLIDDATREVRSAGEDVDGYGQMLDEFAETSSFLDELTRDLAASDARTIDQTYRRMATALKTNNEQRMALVRELDEITDGAILSGVSGQQLSELMPRGIIRAFAASLGGAGLAFGGVPAASSALIPLVVASPRVTGEVVRALGIGARRTEIMIETIGKIRDVLLKAGIIAGSKNSE